MSIFYQNSLNNFGPSPFIVSKTPGSGHYTTITDAYNAAAAFSSAPQMQTIVIYPGVYTESITFSAPNISIQGIGAPVGAPTFISGTNFSGVVMIGTQTIDSASSNVVFTASNITFDCSAGPAVTHTGTVNYTAFTYNNCNFLGSAGAAFHIDAPLASGSINNCNLSSAAGFKTLEIADFGIVNIFSSYLQSTDTIATIANVSGGGELTLYGCSAIDAYDLSGSSTEMIVSGGFINGGAVGGGEPCVTSHTGTLLFLKNCMLSTSATYAIQSGGIADFGAVYTGGFILEAGGVDPLITLPAILPNKFYCGAIQSNGGLATAPVNSNTATAAFSTTLTAGSTVQNTNAYDLLCNITVVVASATTATLTLGVGASSPPTVNTVVPSFSAAGTHSFSAIVPANYYLLVSTTGTISITSITVQSCPM